MFYDCNDTGLYHKTTILANLPLARTVKYDRKVRRKLKRTFTIKKIIVPATVLIHRLLIRFFQISKHFDLALHQLELENVAII